MRKKPLPAKVLPTEQQLIQIERDILTVETDADITETPNSIMVDALLSYIATLLQQPDTQYATFDIALHLVRKYLAIFGAEVDQYQFMTITRKGHRYEPES